MLCSALTRTFHRSTFQRYRNVYHHKQTKNQWARDDPAMVVLIALALALVGTLWSYVHGLTASQTAITVLFMVFRDFLLASAAIATVLWCALFDPLAKRPDLLSANPDLRLRPLSASGSSPTSCCCRLAHIRLRRIRASSGPLRLTSPSTPSSPSFSGFTSGSCFSSDSSRAGRSSLASCLNGAIADRSRTLLSPPQQLGLPLARQLTIPARECSVHLYHVPWLRGAAVLAAHRASFGTVAADPCRLCPIGACPDLSSG